MTSRTPDRARLLAEAHRLRHRAAELERAAHRSSPREDVWLSVLQGDWHAIATRAVDEPHDLLLVALADALLGRTGAARAAAAEAERKAVEDPDALRTVRLVRAVAHLVTGDPGTAFAAFLELAAAEGPGTSFAAVGLLAESAFRYGRPQEARAVVDAASNAATPGSAAAEEAAVARAFVTGSPDEPARTAFGRGRIELAIGMRLRRARDEAAARPHLVIALDHLGLLGATSWTAIAANELRAAGHRVVDTHDVLTEHQLAIARLAARGLSNREIAERLFLSPRTVGTHLYRLFPKLGVTSRHQLPAALHRRAQHDG